MILQYFRSVFRPIRTPNEVTRFFAFSTLPFSKKELLPVLFLFVAIIIMMALIGLFSVVASLMVLVDYLSAEPIQHRLFVVKLAWSVFVFLLLCSFKLPKLLRFLRFRTYQDWYYLWNYAMDYTHYQLLLEGLFYHRRPLVVEAHYWHVGFIPHYALRQKSVAGSAGTDSYFTFEFILNPDLRLSLQMKSESPIPISVTVSANHEGYRKMIPQVTKSGLDKVADAIRFVLYRQFGSSPKYNIGLPMVGEFDVLFLGLCDENYDYPCSAQIFKRFCYPF